MSHPKYFANDPDNLVVEAIDGALALNAGLTVRLDEGWPQQKVRWTHSLERRAPPF